MNTTPNSLGAKNDNNISKQSRDIHPSYIGRFDLNVCGNASPGTSGVITPFCETSGLYFNKDFEPESFKYEFEKDKLEYAEREEGKVAVYAGYKNLKNYFDTQALALENIQKCDIKSEYNENYQKIVINIPLDDDVFY